MAEQSMTLGELLMTMTGKCPGCSEDPNPHGLSDVCPGSGMTNEEMAEAIERHEDAIFRAHHANDEWTEQADASARAELWEASQVTPR